MATGRLLSLTFTVCFSRGVHLLILRPPRCAVAIVAIPYESLFNFSVDAMKPLLRSVGSLLISGDVYFQSAIRSSAAQL